MKKQKIIGWILYIIGLALLVVISDGFKEYIALLFGVSLAIIGDKIKDRREL